MRVVVVAPGEGAGGGGVGGAAPVRRAVGVQAVHSTVRDSGGRRGHGHDAGGAPGIRFTNPIVVCLLHSVH